MRISYFFRKKSSVYHSIENLFHAIIDKVEGYETIKHEAIWESKGFFNRFKIGLKFRKQQADINHITGDIHFVALFLKKKKTILTIHDIGSAKYGSTIKRSLIKFFWFSLPLRRVKFVTVISEFTKQELLKNFKIKQNKVFVINNCISDDYKYFPKDSLSLKPVILQIGTKANKNLGRVINALEGVDCKLLIIGKLSDSQTALLKLKNIDYESFYNLSKEEVLKKYIESDILLFASTYEGFGMPIIEANAVGRPVITSSLEPMKSVAADSALLVNPFSEEEIKDAILKLLNDEKLRSELIEKGLENAKKYRAEYIAKQYMEVYDKIAKKSLKIKI
jgi:glycosyltransferase involved in cell wall biosynthesis